MDAQTLEAISAILNIILGLLATHYGRRFRRARKVLDVLAQTFDDMDKAVRDNRLDPNEIRTILQDLKKLVSEL